jgi:hypothetical protein
MSLPETKICIGKDGKTSIEGMEKSDQCYKLKDIARMSGKVLSEEEKEHTPVYQGVSINNH